MITTTPRIFRDLSEQYEIPGCVLYCPRAEIPGMSERVIPRMTVEAFLDWGLTQDRRYELVDGIPWRWPGPGNATT